MSRPAQIRFLSRFARAYDPVARLLGFRSMWRAVAEAAAPTAGERVLDVCTGTGGSACEITRMGGRVFGVDLSEGMLRRAVRNGSVSDPSSPRFARMDARRMAFADRTFPLVTCSMALHEMAEEERRLALGEIRRVAADRVVVTDYRVPSSRLRQVLFRVAHAFEYLESDDFESFVRRDFRSRLERAGFGVEGWTDVGRFRVWRCRVGRTSSRPAAV